MCRFATAPSRIFTWIALGAEVYGWTLALSGW